jgi:PAS domain S-box-containing protein
MTSNEQIDFRTLFEAVPGLYLILLPDFKIVAASDAYLNATMTIQEEISGKYLFDVFPDNPDDASADGVSNLYLSLVTVLKNKVPHTMAMQKYDIRNPDGTFIEKYWSPLNKPVLNAKNEVVYIIHCVEDITLRRNAEEQLMLANRKLEKLNAILEQEVEDRTKAIITTEKRYRDTLDNILEGAQMIGFDWRYLYVNKSLEKHGKYPKEELIGYTMMEKYPGIETTDVFKTIKRCFDERIAIQMDSEFTFPDNTVGWFELSLQPVPEGVFILSVDVTARKKAEREVKILNEGLEQKIMERTNQLASVNKELEAFTYSVSHDLRAPLRAINGYAKIVQEDYFEKLEEDGRSSIIAILNNSKKMGELIDDLLAFSRLGRLNGVPSEINMTGLVRTVIEEAMVGNNGNVIFVNQNQNLLPAKGEQVLIKQVWTNLISNAIKYSKYNAKTIIEIGSYYKDNMVTYYVRDNGAGFDMKYYDKLFGVFQRLHSQDEFEGTGIGLAIVQKVINHHKGKIWAESYLNEGSCFYFSLPTIHS